MIDVNGGWTWLLEMINIFYVADYYRSVECANYPFNGLNVWCIPFGKWLSSHSVQKCEQLYLDAATRMDVKRGTELAELWLFNSWLVAARIEWQWTSTSIWRRTHPNTQTQMAGVTLALLERSMWTRPLIHSFIQSSIHSSIHLLTARPNGIQPVVVHSI